MPVPLQKGPLGLLGAFALKVLGQNPTAFGDTVVPVADVYDQYLATSELVMVRLQPTIAIGASSATATFPVPPGKVWRLIAASIGSTLNAADAAFTSQAQVALQSPNGAPGTCIVAAAQHAAGNVGRVVGSNFRPPIFLPSGWNVVSNFNTSAVLTVQITVAASLVYQEFDL